MYHKMKKFCLVQNFAIFIGYWYKPKILNQPEYNYGLIEHNATVVSNKLVLIIEQKTQQNYSKAFRC